MITMKSAREMEIMRRGGKITSSVLAMLMRTAKAGMTLREVDRLADKGIRAQGGVPTFKGYHGYPASICASLNEVVVHGIPGDQVLKEGDLLSIDIGTTFEGYVSDTAATVGIGKVSPEAERLMRVTQECLMIGVGQIRKGNRLSDIGHAVQAHAERNGYGVVRALVGHGIGSQMHEEPQVPNWGSPGRGITLKPGLCLAVEPMITEGTYEVETLQDGWTVVTADGKLAAHFEHTVALTDDGPRILTLRDHDFMELDVAPYRPKEEIAA